MLPRFRDFVRFLIATAQGAWEEESIADTRKLGNILKAKDVDAWIDFWGDDVNHDWPWWYQQMNYFLAEMVGRVQVTGFR